MVAAALLVFPAAAAADSRSFTPVADSYVTSADPSSSHASEARLAVRGDPDMRTYLKFDVHLPPDAQITGATLSLYTGTGSTEVGYQAYAVEDSSWDESSLDHADAPPFGDRLGTSGGWSGPGYKAIDIPARYIHSGANSIGAGTGALSPKTFWSREAEANPPRLVIDYVSAEWVPPSNTSPPAVSGVARAGATLTADPGKWSGGEPVAFAYQWQRCDPLIGCNDIMGATARTYDVVSSDVDHALRVAVTGSNRVGNARAVSHETASVAAPRIQYRYAFSNREDQESMPSYGYNLIDVSSKEEADATPAGTRGLVWVGDYDNGSCSWEVGDAALRAKVESMAGDPKVAGYFYANESDPFACPRAIAAHRARNDLIKSIDPQKFTLITVDSNSGDRTLRQIPMWTGAADYIDFNPYICYRGKPCDFRWLDTVLAAADQAGNPYFIALQAFGDSEWRWPTAAEEKRMLDRLGTSGASGYMTFSWNWMDDPLRDHPSVLDAIKEFNLGTIAETTPPSAPVILAAGDICEEASKCRPTADLVDSLSFDRLLTLGDAAYEDGTLADYRDSYDPNFGRDLPRTSPTPGNHDYHVPGAADYFTYFGARAPAGYYSYDLGAWHIISLDGDIAAAAGSPQETWLKKDLAAHPARCTLAYWHEPRFSSGTTHGGSSDYDAFWRDLYAAGADVVLNGHEHNYERFAPQTPDATPDPNGIREFVAGTGGGTLYGFGPPAANSEKRDNSTFGVLQMTLHTDSYDWKFIPTGQGAFTDTGTGTCH